VLARPGYWWLAYTWENWLYACDRCNSAWKRSFFPVQEVPHPCPPHPDTAYTPLLLDPFGPEDPLEHLQFTDTGAIQPRNGSARGLATIRTCGLHRPALLSQRLRIAGDARRYIGRLEHALVCGNFEEAERAVEDLLSLGADDRAHAGVVRSLVWDRLDVRWQSLPQLLETFREEDER
jgi:hypothetical protein